jgi:nucleoside phosphorylase
MDYKRLKEIVFLLWDNKNDYQDEDTQTRIGDLFKSKHRVYDDEGYRLSDVLHLYEENPNQEFLFFIHLDHNNKNKGYKTFKSNSEIGTAYPNLNYYLVSRVPRKDIYEDGTNRLMVYDWEEIFLENGVDGTFTPQTTTKMKQEKKSPEKLPSNNPNLPPIKYAIFTALYEEFEAIEDLFEWNNELEEKTGTMTYRIGTLKGTDKLVAAGFPGKTGMTEAAIICTEMIYRYEPEYLLMPGVCGGSSKTEFGDVIVASKVFPLGMGKVTDVKEIIDGEEKNVTLHYENKPLELNKITGTNGENVRITCEVLKEESESIILNEGLLQDLRPKLNIIQEKINNHRPGPNEKITVRFEPMACSLSVIDKAGYFESNILSKDRKTKAVEMESYGVARAAQKANGGKTKFLIFKSVMDKTDLKTDNYKELAAYTSAQFLKHLLKENII